MHTFIYPNQNSYITNESGYETSNFSLDSILEVKSINTIQSTFKYYTDYAISESVSSSCGQILFNGYLEGTGSANIHYAELVVTGSANFNTDVYNGYIGATYVTAYSGSVYDASISGSVSGSFNGQVDYLQGNVFGFTGSFVGYEYGSQSVYQPTKVLTVASEVSRTLMQFDLTAISESIAAKDIPTGSLKFILTLKAAEEKELPLKYTLLAYPLLQTWNIGTGRYQLGGTDDGVSWEYTDYAGGTPWSSSGAYYTTNSIYSGSQPFNHSNSDVRMDLTNMAMAWISGSLENNGLVVVTSLESSSQVNNNLLQFFSTETNTIYSPYLDVYWDESIYNTGSLLPVEQYNSFTLVAQDLSPQYNFGNMVRINVFAREKYPLKNFIKGTLINQYISSSYVPHNTFYSIKDNESEEVIVDFDEGTRLSCDGFINYFILDTTGLPQERYYRILFKSICADGRVTIVDNKSIFKIVR